MESSTRRTTQKRKMDKKELKNITHTQFKNGPVAKKKRKFICSEYTKLRYLKKTIECSWFQWSWDMSRRLWILLHQTIIEHSKAWQIASSRLMRLPKQIVCYGQSSLLINSASNLHCHCCCLQQPSRRSVPFRARLSFVHFMSPANTWSGFLINSNSLLAGSSHTLFLQLCGV